MRREMHWSLSHRWLQVDFEEHQLILFGYHKMSSSFFSCLIFFIVTNSHVCTSGRRLLMSREPRYAYVWAGYIGHRLSVCRCVKRAITGSVLAEPLQWR